MLALLAAVSWKARHRIRGYFAKQTAEAHHQSLEVLSNGSEPQPAAAPSMVTSKDWPGWRGFQGNNHAYGPMPPMTWSETENVLWKTSVPGRGHSSPCIVGSSIFVTTAIENVKSQEVVCLDFDSGRIEWTQRVHQGEFIYRNLKNSHASSTPVSDGHSVFVLFAVDDSIWLSSLSLSGEILWQCNCGPYASKEGFGASPLVSGDVIIVAADSVERSWIAAVHRKSGKLVWRKSRGPGTSYASPALMTNQESNVVVLGGLDRVTAFDPTDGRELWHVAGPDMSASTPSFGDGMIVVTGCTPKAGVSGVRLSSPPETAWNIPVKVEVPSPLITDGLVWLVQDAGILMCCDVQTGELIFRQRLGGNVTASPVLCGDHILISMEDGRTIAIKNSREWSKVSENLLECEGIYATPAIVRGCIIMRTLDSVYAIGSPPPQDHRQN